LRLIVDYSIAKFGGQHLLWLTRHTSQIKRFDGKKALALPGEPRAKLVGEKNTSGGREMSMQSSGGTYESESVIPFAPKNAVPDNADQLDRAGQTILQLLHKAAGVAEANSKHALDMAQKLSHQLRAAENRIAELEAEVGIYQDKADRAEQWLHKVYTEIEDRFLQQDDGRHGMTGAPQRPAARRK
jgi:hypothetical protein